MNFKNESLIIDIISEKDTKLMKMTGNPILDEYFLWKELKYDNLIEIDDLNKIKQMKHLQIKTFSLSVIMSIIGVKVIDFINVKKGIKLFLKSSVFISIFYYKFMLQFINNFICLHSYMNNKYYGRYKNYLKIGDPLLMNQTFFSHESLSEDEKNSLKLLYDKLKYKQECIIKKEKYSQEIINKIEDRLKNKL